MMKSKNKHTNGYFTGIGSRDTPEKYLWILEEATRYIVDKFKIVLRSGHAQGADRACEKGAKGHANIYLPWTGYGLKQYRNDPGMEVIGEVFIPSELNQPNLVKVAKFMCDQIGRQTYQSMSRGVKSLMFRNVCQIVGHFEWAELSRTVLCYDSGTSGTSYATALAKHFQIPIINVKNKNLNDIIIEIDASIPSFPASRLTNTELIKDML